jgi:uncharacterized protein YkwD
VQQALGKLVHSLVNVEREKSGLPLLTEVDILVSIAEGHSQDMAIRHYFDHENPDGLDASERAARAGYPCRKDYGVYYTIGVAENIYQGWLYSSVTYINGIPIKHYLSIEQIAIKAVQGWMGSPGHRANILDNSHDRVGTGVAISQDGKVFITQNFC